MNEWEMLILISYEAKSLEWKQTKEYYQFVFIINVINDYNFLSIHIFHLLIAITNYNFMK